jgi:hypothetical protein
MLSNNATGDWAVGKDGRAGVSIVDTCFADGRRLAKEELTCLEGNRYQYLKKM